MKVQLINEMTVTTRGGYQVKYEANEELDFKKDKDENLLIVDNDDNKVVVDDEEIFEAVMKNARYGKKREGTARVPLKAVLEEVDPELVADFMAATNQVPNESAEKGAEEHMKDEDWSHEDLMIDVPVTVADDSSLEDKVDVLMKEEAFEDIAPETSKDMEVLSVELVDDAPAFIKNQDNNPEAKDIAEDDMNDPKVAKIDEEPHAKGEEFYEAIVNVKRMREEVELSINPEGGIDIVAGKTSTDMISEDEEFIEPELGAAGVDAPTEEEPMDEPVITEEEDKDHEESPIKDPEDSDKEDEDDSLDKLLDEPMGECNK